METRASSVAVPRGILSSATCRRTCRNSFDPIRLWNQTWSDHGLAPREYRRYRIVSMFESNRHRGDRRFSSCTVFALLRRGVLDVESTRHGTNGEAFMVPHRS